ncbi:hypothetical protein IF655_07185 [Streptomyces sp. DSM 110735]|uniref:hypothetical protein n=1 Tax=Streptomyces sp. DSM 110735 TaxID=2775031 RepID=UPI0018F4F2B4|nr:hypothetical protein [Streptomyces sp. DSM 110735]MBJ7903084.1 hypothetical protein [Streptomyces sp. DSM 110735]
MPKNAASDKRELTMNAGPSGNDGGNTAGQQGDGTPGGATPGGGAPAPQGARQWWRGLKFESKHALIALVITACSGIVVPLVVPLIGKEDGDKKDDGAPAASSPVSVSPAGVSPTATSTGQREQAPLESVPPSITPSSTSTALQPFPGEPMTLTLTEPPCRIRTEIDFDKVPFTHRVETELNDEKAQPGVDMVWVDCTITELRTATEARAGVVPRGTEVTKDTCLDAANGGGLETLQMGVNADTYQVRAGATICVLTDQGRLLAAYVTDKVDAPTKLALKVRTMT